MLGAHVTLQLLEISVLLVADVADAPLLLVERRFRAVNNTL